MADDFDRNGLDPDTTQTNDVDPAGYPPERTADTAQGSDVDEIKDFESAIKELEAIVARLEQGDLPLEDSLKQYERGVHLSRYCHGRLEDAERRIEILSERGDRRPAPELLAETPQPHRGDRRPATKTTSDPDDAGPAELDEDDIPF